MTKTSESAKQETDRERVRRLIQEAYGAGDADIFLSHIGKIQTGDPAEIESALRYGVLWRPLKHIDSDEVRMLLSDARNREGVDELWRPLFDRLRNPLALPSVSGRLALHPVLICWIVIVTLLALLTVIFSFQY